ncbi:MAG: zinc ribbon domain-containing protein [Lachnospiraceae bacterium]|nr:zinc ribbon domain-containing protein [Lachnospiraceae bacterium]
MICRACGRIIINEQANFCEYCGTPVDEARGGASFTQGNAAWQGAAGAQGSYGAGQQENYAGNGYGEYRENHGGYGAPQEEAPQGVVGALLGTSGGPEKEGSMSMLQWLGIMLLPFVPMVGAFAYLIVLLTWGFGKTATKTRKSWARATLIMLVIAFVMMFYMIGGMASDGTLAQLMGTLPAE